MSAYIVDQDHIDAMVALALDGPAGIVVSPYNAWLGPRWQAETPDGPIRHYAENYDSDALGTMLIAECVASVAYRYHSDDDLPGPVDRYYERPYRFAPPSPMPTAIEGLKLLDCYEYQSCEHPGWATSEAASFCEALRRSLIHKLAGYDAAPWEWEQKTAVR